MLRSFGRPLVPTVEKFVVQRKLATWKAKQARSKFGLRIGEKPSGAAADWIFIRKYSTAVDSTRKALRAHTDTNEHSVNLALNSVREYTGGGLFVMHPPPQKPGHDYETSPSVPKEWQTLGWLENLKRENTSEALFPHMEAGTAVVHNNTVFHGIAPLDSGTKYSLLFFFDMPPVEEMNSDRFEIEFVSRHSKPAELYWIPEGGGKPTLVESDWPAGSKRTQQTFSGHRFQAREAGTGAILKEFEISHANHVYTLDAPGDAPARTGADREL